MQNATVVGTSARPTNGRHMRLDCEAHMSAFCTWKIEEGELFVALLPYKREKRDNPDIFTLTRRFVAGGSEMDEDEFSTLVREAGVESFIKIRMELFRAPFYTEKVPCDCGGDVFHLKHAFEFDFNKCFPGQKFRKGQYTEARQKDLHSEWVEKLGDVDWISVHGAFTGHPPLHKFHRRVLQALLRHLMLQGKLSPALEQKYAKQAFDVLPEEEKLGIAYRIEDGELQFAACQPSVLPPQARLAGKGLNFISEPGDEVEWVEVRKVLTQQGSYFAAACRKAVMWLARHDRETLFLIEGKYPDLL